MYRLTLIFRLVMDESYPRPQDLFLTVFLVVFGVVFGVVFLAVLPTNRRVIMIGRVKQVLAKP